MDSQPDVAAPVERSVLFQAVTWARAAPVQGAMKSILFALAARVNKERIAFPSRELLAHDAGLSSVACVSRTLKKLQQGGYITIVKAKRKTGKYYRNEYKLHLHFQPWLDQSTAETDPCSTST